MITYQIKYRLKLSLTVAILLFLSGCAKYYGAATIVSVPAGAEVVDTKDESVVGITPLTVHWEDSSRTRRYVALRLKKAGYRDQISHFWVSMRHKSKQNAVRDGETVKVELESR